LLADGGAAVAVPCHTTGARAMRRLGRRCLALAAFAVALTSLLPSAAAQLTVFDPANYQQNLATAARALEQINNQVRQLQAQAQVRFRLDQTLQRLGSTIQPDLERSLLALKPQLAAGEGIGLKLQATQTSYEQLFPKAVSSSLSSDDVLRNAASRWEQEYA